MKNHKLLLLAILFFLVGSSPMLAATFTVSGQVTIDQQSIPSGGVPVYIISFGDHQTASINTDDNGVYTFTFDIDTPDAVFFLIDVFDECSGHSTAELVSVDPDGTGTVDFLLCGENTGGPVDCGCPAIDNEVCVDLGQGLIIPFPNPCEAECAGFDATQYVECDFGGGPVGCGCPTEIDVVCVAIDLGIIVPYSNACEAECAGYGPADFVDCDTPVDTTTCNCPFVDDPVCVEIFENFVIPFPNACEALCAGYDSTLFVDCVGVPVDTTHCGCSCDWDPVCITIDSTEVLTFVNACLAECEGYDPADFEVCEHPGGPVDCGCPTEIDEVCVELFPGLTIPFPNACEAACAGFDSTLFVDCNLPIDTTTNCNCPIVEDIVCVEIFEDVVIPFPNACEAACAGFDSTMFVDCGIFTDTTTTGCNCPIIDDPVCVQSGHNVIPFPNACEALCAGYDASMFVECTLGCGCPIEIDEVCVELFPGVSIWFANSCEAVCAGYDSTMFVDCNIVIDTTTTGCNCPTEIDEVCVELFPGLTVPFPNACEALCAGFDSTMFVDCELGGGPVGCGCPTVYDPICVEVSPDFVVEYPNPCEALCDGYDPIDFVACTPPPIENECQAFFLPVPTTDLEVEFFELSLIGANATWAWDFGDGNTSTEQSPTHTYSAEGTYEVTLTVTDDDCTSTFPMFIWVGDFGTSSFCQAIYFPEVNDLEVSFVNFSIGDNESWSWDFGDGNTSTEKTPTHTYAEKEVYVVTVETTTKGGCVSEFELVVDLITGNLHGNAVPENRVTSTKELSAIEASKVSPNPAQSDIFVDLEVKTSTAARINIRSIDGRVVQSSLENLSVGQERLEYNVSGLPQGMYFLQIQTGKSQEVLKFIKQ